MKAAIRSKYGPPDVLHVGEVEKPTPCAGEVLIRVHAATANRSDLHVLTGRPWPMRLLTGLSRPRRCSTGTDFAGEVEAAGPGVKAFAVGQKVMGFGGPFGMGSHAEYLTFPEDKGIVPMPANLDYREAAACIEGASYVAGALMYLKPRSGERALVNGATGAIGSAYVQLLTYFGVRVTAVCRKEHFDLMASLGADKTIDYATDNFTRDEDRYDYVFDAVGKASFLRCRRLLKEKGLYAGNNPMDLVWAVITLLSPGKKVLLPPPPNIREVLLSVQRIVGEGKFTPVIDRTYPLDQIVDAFRYVATGEKTGNVVVTMR